MTRRTKRSSGSAGAPACRARLFHTLRHTFGTHAALFGVNPWRLQAWLGHKRIDETMLYVHVAESHPRELPEHVKEAAATESGSSSNKGAGRAPGEESLPSKMKERPCPTGSLS